MNLKRYVPSEQPHAVALRIGPHVLFLSGCLLGILTVVPVSSVGGIQTGRLGAGAFALALAVVAGKGVANDQYLRPVVATALAIALGTITISSVTIVDPSTVTQITMTAYVVWVVIGELTQIGIHQDEDPAVGDHPRDEWSK